MMSSSIGLLSMTLFEEAAEFGSGAFESHRFVMSLKVPAIKTTLKAGGGADQGMIDACGGDGARTPMASGINAAIGLDS
jgi:hypothetical protein